MKTNKPGTRVQSRKIFEVADIDVFVYGHRCCQRVDLRGEARTVRIAAPMRIWGDGASVKQR